ncbi:MAG: DUF4446 family protein [Bacillota bacterium]
MGRRCARRRIDMLPGKQSLEVISLLEALVTPYATEIIAGLAAFALLAFLLLLILHWRLSRKVQRLHLLLRGADHPTLQETLEAYHNFLVQVDARLEEMMTRQKAAEQALQSCVRTPSLLRFNAFPDMGSDLSFALALLDGRADGVVLSSLYGRSESRTYAKPVRKGASSYHLTEEEKTVIAQALGGAAKDNVRGAK